MWTVLAPCCTEGDLITENYSFQKPHVFVQSDKQIYSELYDASCIVWHYSATHDSFAQGAVNYHCVSFILFLAYTIALQLCHT